MSGYAISRTWLIVGAAMNPITAAWQWLSAPGGQHVGSAVCVTAVVVTVLCGVAFMREGRG